MALRIEQYAMIGDSHTAALVGSDGSIDWLCLPRFDAPACFASLLGTSDHGSWIIAPTAGGIASARRYRPGSLVLETEFETADGAVRLTDCMPTRQSHPRIVRIVEGTGGRVPMRAPLHPAIRLRTDATVGPRWRPPSCARAPALMRSNCGPTL